MQIEEEKDISFQGILEYVIYFILMCFTIYEAFSLVRGGS